MSDVTIFRDKLLSLAKQKKLKDIEDIIKSDDFFKSLDKICYVISKLDMQILEKNEVDFNYIQDINLKISRALAKNYFTMYYVNMETGDYVGYSSSDDYKSLNIQENGHDFFNDVKHNIEKVIYPEDKEYMLNNFNKTKVIEKTKNGKAYELVYRLVINKVPRYVCLKALKLTNDDTNIIIGVTNIDEQAKKEIEYKKAIQENATYTNIALALVRNYFLLYYVDMSDGSYIRYRIDTDNQTLTETDRGSDFFADSRKNAKIYLVEEDQEKFINALLNKDKLLKDISNGKTLKLTYQQIIDNVAVYVQLTSLTMTNDSSHVLFAVSNIDDQMRKEQEYSEKLNAEKIIARTDGLTGKLNKYSYNELERKINKNIENGTLDDFSIIVCDLNNLKLVNDTLGHEAGDEYIKDGANLLQKHFKNSSVFRIGGDEFAIIIDNSEFYTRDFLLERLNKENHQNKKLGRVTLAIGMSDFDKKTDTSLAQVFKRADDKMYQYKKEFKGE